MPPTALFRTSKINLQNSPTPIPLNLIIFHKSPSNKKVLLYSNDGGIFFLNENLYSKSPFLQKNDELWSTETCFTRILLLYLQSAPIVDDASSILSYIAPEKNKKV